MCVTPTDGPDELEVIQVDTVTGTVATDGQLTASCADHNDR